MRVDDIYTFSKQLRYVDISLVDYASNVGYRVLEMSPTRVIKDFGHNSGVPPLDTIEIKITLCRLSDGQLSSIIALPRLGITATMLDSFPKACH